MLPSFPLQIQHYWDCQTWNTACGSWVLRQCCSKISSLAILNGDIGFHYRDAASRPARIQDEARSRGLASSSCIFIRVTICGICLLSLSRNFNSGGVISRSWKRSCRGSINKFSSLRALENQRVSTTLLLECLHQRRKDNRFGQSCPEYTVRESRTSPASFDWS